MELSTIQVSAQKESVQEPAPRKRVRNWRNKESQATFNDSTSVTINNVSEPGVKVKTSSKSNDKVQISPKLNAVDKEQSPAKSEPTLPKSNILKSSNTPTPKNSSSKSSNQTSPKSSDTTSPKPNVQAPPAKTDSQGSPKANVRVLPPVTRGKGSQRSNGQTFFTRLNNKNSSGFRNKRIRDNGAGFKNNTENQQ